MTANVQTTSVRARTADEGQDQWTGPKKRTVWTEEETGKSIRERTERQLSDRPGQEN